MIALFDFKHYSRLYLMPTVLGDTFSETENGT